MTDLLVKLYELNNDWIFLTEQANQEITIRKPIGPEKSFLIAWVREKFEAGWASEMDMSFSNRPISCFVAIQKQTPIGFACYDATALGFLGPMGVDASCRGRGTGRGLLMACLLDMKLKGYGYAVIGDVGPVAFYQKTVGAIEIPDSTPGIYKNCLPT